MSRDADSGVAVAEGDGVVPEYHLHTTLSVLTVFVYKDGNIEEQSKLLKRRSGLMRYATTLI